MLPVLSLREKGSIKPKNSRVIVSVSTWPLHFSTNKHNRTIPRAALDGVWFLEKSRPSIVLLNWTLLRSGAIPESPPVQLDVEKSAH